MYEMKLVFMKKVKNNKSFGDFGQFHIQDT